MPKQGLKSNLEDLRQELAATKSLDEATREQLHELADAIESALEEPAADRESTRARAADAALQFEAEHPRFARILSEVTDALAKLGF